jgi:putative nucleotidyltransferase with HDIG domain
MTRRSEASFSFELSGGELSQRVLFHGVRWGMLLTLALLTYSLYPVPGGFDVPLIEPGKVSPVDVVAPFEFKVKKSAAEIAREAGALAATVRPIYEYRTESLDSVLAGIDSVFGAFAAAGSAAELASAARRYGIRFSPEEAEFLRPASRQAAFRRALVRMAQQYLVRGVAGGGALEFELSSEVVIRRNGSEQVMHRDSVLSFQRYLSARTAVHPAPNSSLGDQVFVKLVHGLFRPTLVPNVIQTERLRAELRASVDSVKDVVRENERIVAAHEVVSPEAYDRLLALRNELARRNEGRSGTLAEILGQLLSNGLILSIFWLLLMIYRKETYGDLKQMVLVALLCAITIAGAFVNYRILFKTSAPELIPVPFAAMLLTILISGRVGMFAALVLAVLLGSQAVYGGQNAWFIALLGGVSGALGVRTISRRSQLLAASFFVLAGFTAAALSLALRFDWSLGQLIESIGFGAVNAAGSAALTILALPVFERFSGTTSQLTLLELSDPSHPLLRRLASEAPGTYAHSVAMANLCEAACNAIGANGLLARVGCYYHDVGKIRKPQFFVENQASGMNPHEKLKPEVSATIIRNHVKEGLALADEHRLPEVVKAFIPEHHGTLEISYFLDRARSRNGAEEVPAELFRYPGPKPRSVETAVTMLADGVEAAIRVLDGPTPQRVREVIEHIFHQRIAGGQLREAPLTLAQLERVKEEFVRVLSGMYHNRIDYPISSGGITSEWEAAAGETKSR